jgi:crotonobetaine/carnitine-CoA ligase
VTTPEPAHRTLNDLLQRRAEEDGGRQLLQFGDRRWSVAEFRTSVARRAAGLRAAGIQPGDRVAAISRNRYELAELFFACAWNGSILAPVNAASRGAQLAHILDDVEPALVTGEADLLTEAPARSIPFEALPDGDDEPEAHPAGPADTLTILYTSGTTGPSKGVLCPHAQFWWWGVKTAAALGVGPEDMLFTCLPLFHTNALNTLVQALVTGARCTIAPRFSATSFWRELTDSEATVTYILGAMASILVARDPGELDRAHRVRTALAPGTPPAVWEAFQERFGISLVEGHGMTETNFAIGPRDGEQRPGTMGRALPGFEARVVGENGGDVPDGVSGELLLRSDEPLAFATGYHRLPEETSRAWANGWFRTGDRVVRDEDGFIRFLDRVKDSIRRRGENISAWEVEQAVGSHPAVTAVAVVGVPSDLGEEEVMAFVVARDDALEAAEVVRHCEPRLAYFAIPRYVEFVEELPLTENGKVRKAALRERGLSDATWDRERAGLTLRRRV